LTPDKLKAEEQRSLFAVCDQALAQNLDLLRPALLVGVGVFAEQRLRRVAPDHRVGRIPHPSPASPLANRGFGRLAASALRELGVDLPGESQD
jgi:single-strand selective monofunctional uracil DNA glycosylase